jgi:two-component system NarL family response regulator
MTSTGSDRLHVHIDHAMPLVTAGLVSALRDRQGFNVSDPSTLHPDMRLDVFVADLPRLLTWKSGARLNGVSSSQTPARAVVLSDSDCEIHVRQALEAGAYGYLLLDSSLEALAECIRSVARVQRLLCESAARRMAESITHKQLTDRENEILQLVANGDCNKRIALKLDIAVGTVKSHVRCIHHKLEASCRTQAVNIASARGLLETRSHGAALSTH